MIDSVENPKQVKTKLLVCNGADDSFVSAEQIDAFKKAMVDAGVNFKFVNYPGAIHAFSNPDADSLGKKFNLPLAYNKQADEESWKDMKEFLKRYLSNLRDQFIIILSFMPQKRIMQITGFQND